MEWINAIVTAVCSLLAAIGGGSIIYVKQNRAMKEVEVELKKQEGESKEIEQWKELYQEVKSENKRLSSKVDELYRQQHQLTRQLYDLQSNLVSYSCMRVCDKRMRFSLDKKDAPTVPTAQTTQNSPSREVGQAVKKEVGMY